MKKPANALQVLSTTAHQATTIGEEKLLLNQLELGLSCAVQAIDAFDDNEQRTLLNEASIAYQEAIYLTKQTSTPRPVAKSLQQLGTFLTRNQQGN